MVGSIMARTPRRSSSRPKIGVAIADRTKLIPNAVDSVPRPKPSSSVIGLIKRLALNNCMVPDENISAVAEAPAIHHLFLNIAFLPPFGDIVPKPTLVLSPWAVSRPTPINPPRELSTRDALPPPEPKASPKRDHRARAYPTRNRFPLVHSLAQPRLRSFESAAR